MDRLAWRTAPRTSVAQWDELVRFADAARHDGLSRTLVCGMGGSSLAPEVLASSFANASLSVLDSTDPSAVLAVTRAADFDRTLFVVCSKSGTTVETLAFYHYLAARADAARFVAITDPGSPLEALAHSRGFRGVFRHPPDVGGRYAALTVVGMLPAALLGVNGRDLLERALAVDTDAARARGARFAEATLAGRDKLVLRPPAPVARLAGWIEQLVAESTGKDGRGVVPVVDDPIMGPRPDSQIVRDFSADPLALGAEFLAWEYTTWELCTGLGVNAFDQPDVEEAKALARAELAGRLRHAMAGDRSQAPCTGDWVLARVPPVREDGSPALLHRVLMRRTKFSRKEAGDRTAEQIIAANVDTIFLVQSLNLNLNPRRLERYLALAPEATDTDAIREQIRSIRQNQAKLN